ncbi:MAG: hypothetical protein ACJAUP_000271 [Cellvibrionaceae bacterium]
MAIATRLEGKPPPTVLKQSANIHTPWRKKIPSHGHLTWWITLKNSNKKIMLI